MSTEETGHVSWWAKMYQQVAKMHAINTETEGMKAENANRILRGEAQAYPDDMFSEQARLLRQVAEELGKI